MELILQTDGQAVKGPYGFSMLKIVGIELFRVRNCSLEENFVQTVDLQG